MVFRNLMAAVTVIAAFIALAGAAALQPNVMGVAGIVAAVAAIVWGLIDAIRRPCRRRMPPPYVVERRPADLHARVVHTPPVARTVFRGGKQPAWSGDTHARPFWDTDVMGAPE